MLDICLEFLDVLGFIYNNLLQLFKIRHSRNTLRITTATNSARTIQIKH